MSDKTVNIKMALKYIDQNIEEIEECLEVITRCKEMILNALKDPGE